MKEGKPFEGMMDLARKSAGKLDADFTGVFEPDPEAVKAWATPLSQDDNGEFRHFNKSPQELKELLDQEQDPDEVAAIEKALQFWGANNGFTDPNDSRATQAGEPYRGEPKIADTPKSIKAMVEGRQPVDHIYVLNTLRRNNMDPEIVVDKNTKPEEFVDGMGLVKGPAGIWEEK